MDIKDILKMGKLLFNSKISHVKIKGDDIYELMQYIQINDMITIL